MKNYIAKKWNSYSPQAQMLLVVIGLSLLHITITIVKY